MWHFFPLPVRELPQQLLTSSSPSEGSGPGLSPTCGALWGAAQ